MKQPSSSHVKRNKQMIGWLGVGLSSVKLWEFSWHFFCFYILRKCNVKVFSKTFDFIASDSIELQKLKCFPLKNCIFDCAKLNSIHRNMWACHACRFASSIHFEYFNSMSGCVNKRITKKAVMWKKCM